MALLGLLWGCSQEKQPEQTRSAVPVVVYDVQTTTFEQTVRGIGSLEAGSRIVMRPEISGIVKVVHFQEGKKVEPGEKLITLRTEKLEEQLAASRSALEAARADLERRRRSYDRFAALFKKDTISREELDRVETEFKTARAEVDRLEAEVRLALARIEDAHIEAPTGGVLSESLVDPGDYVEEGDDLVTLYDLERMEIAFTVSGNRIGLIKEGQPVRIIVGAYPDRIFPGRVVFLDPAVDPATRTLLVKARVDNPDSLLTPGSFATVEVVVDRRMNRPAVPEKALVAVRTGYVVFTVSKEGTASRRQVTLGLRRPGLAEVTSGITPGERVVVEGHMNLSPGIPLSIQSVQTLPGSSTNATSTDSEELAR